MKHQMQAAVVAEFGKPLAFRELDISSPGADQILVQTEACGVCETDVHAWRGGWPHKPSLPFITGHEAIGLVTAVGSGVTIVTRRMDGDGRCRGEVHHDPGSVVGTRRDLTETLEFSADGRVKADIELQPLSAIYDVLGRLEHGDVASRVAIAFGERQ